MSSFIDPAKALLHGAAADANPPPPSSSVGVLSSPPPGLLDFDLWQTDDSDIDPSVVLAENDDDSRSRN
jgi:hypothetical protein